MQFRTAATTASRPRRRYATRKRDEYTIDDPSPEFARDLAGRGLGIDLPDLDKPKRNSLIATLMDLVA